MNILITGAGGAAAISFFRAVSHLEDVNVFMADMDPYSTGLYLVPADRRALVPAGGATDFCSQILALCKQKQIDAVIPTVDCELAPLASQREVFREAGIQLITSSEGTLNNCYDKYQLMEALKGKVPLVEYQLLDEDFAPETAGYPLVVKPRIGSGSRGVRVINNLTDLKGIPFDGNFLAQEYLPGKEYSVDIFINKSGKAIASVVRERIKVDSGIAVISQTVINKEISVMAEKIALHIGIRYVANVQLKLDHHNRPRLLEINPRFPGTMPLTVAAGVNMPELCIKEIRGEQLPESISYECIAMVRSWQESYLSPSEFLSLQASNDWNSSETLNSASNI
jgi:carbamoyl-phosphate synthase large subunit